jgi:hypothetical protein
MELVVKERGRRRRAGLVVGVAAAVTALCWATGDWWAVGASARNIALARCLLFAMVSVTAMYLPVLVRRTPVVGWVVFGSWSLYLGAWLTAMWPGIVMTDTQAQVDQARHGVVAEWFSYLHAALTIAVLDVYPHVATFGVLHVLGTAALFAWASTLLHRRSSGSLAGVVAMNLLAALSAPVVVNTLLYSRDTVFALLHVALGLKLAELASDRRRPTTTELVGLVLLTAWLSVYRGDGIALAIVVPLLLLLLLRPARRQALLGGGAFALAVLVVAAVIPRAFWVTQQDAAYQLSLRLNPLGAVLQSEFFSPSKEEDLAVLSKVIDVDATRRLSTPAEIPVYWGGYWDPQATEQERKEFNQVADRLLVDNASTVLSNRLQTFLIASGLGPGQFTTVPLAEDERYSFITTPAGLKADPPSAAVYDAAAELLTGTYAYRGSLSTSSALQWNFIPWLFLLGGVLVGSRRLRFEGVFAAVILCRLPLVFVAAPAAQFKYYYSVWLGGVVVAGWVVARFDPARAAARATGWLRDRAPRVWRVAAFAAVSGGGLALDYSLYAVLCRTGLAPGWANAVSASVAVSAVYVVSVRRIFDSREGLASKSFALYVGYQLAAVGLASLAVQGMDYLLGGRYLLAKLTVLPFTFTANFVFMSWLLGTRSPSMELPHVTQSPAAVNPDVQLRTADRARDRPGELRR